MPVTLRLPLLRSPMVWFAAILLGFVLGLLVPGNRFIVVPLLVAAVLAAAALVVRVLFPPVVIDLERHLVRLGSAEVSIATIDRVTRRAEISPSAAYLTYRLHSSDGPSARVLVAGRPLRGLDESGARALREVIALAPIAVPDDGGLTDRQAAIAANLQGDRGAHPAGRELLLAELDELIGTADDAGDPGAPVPDARREPAAAPTVDPAEARRAVTEPGPVPEPDPEPVPEEHLADLDADEADARSTIAALSPAPTRALVVGVLVVVLGALAFAGGLIAGVVVETTTGARTEGGTHAAVVGWVLAGLVAGLAGTLSWSIGADLRAVQRRRAAAAWLAAADPARRERGLARAFWPAEADAANRTIAIGWFSGLVIALLAALALIVLLIEGEYPGIAFGAFAVAVVAGVAGVGGWIIARRRRSAAAARLAVLIDRRIRLEQSLVEQASGADGA
ncbi:hypothetical protein [Agromyces sp. SYSU T00194]|uniref:hypothetical protein n=1 Tax=Agromyces chitinivorans TaxID=3158560 RepID=UPI0033941EDA